MKMILNWVLNRLKEGTTWVGLISVVQGAGLYISPEIAETFVPFALAVVGTILVKRENNPGIDTTGGTVTLKPK